MTGGAGQLQTFYLSSHESHAVFDDIRVVQMEGMSGFRLLKERFHVEERGRVASSEELMKVMLHGMLPTQQPRFQLERNIAFTLLHQNEKDESI